MALDHFVSQVHLRNFYSPVLGDLMYAIRKIEPECVYVVSRFASYVKTCSPGGMRIHAAQLRTSSARALDAAGAIPPPPDSLGGAALTELQRDGKIGIKVDQKYPQAIGIANCG